MTIRLRSAWRPLLGFAILLIVAAGVSPAAIGDRLAVADLRLAIIALLGLVAVHALPAAGWWAILGTTTGVWLPRRSAMSLFYAAQAIGGITPANLGGDIHRAATLRGAGHGWSVAVVPLIVQRATSYLALSGLSLAALVIVAASTPVAGGLVAVGTACAGVIAAAAWMLLAPPKPLRGAYARLAGWVGGGSRPTSVAVPRLGAATLIGIGSGLLFHAASIGLAWVLVVAVDPGIPAAPVLGSLAVARLSLAVPFVPSGLGVQEGALALLFASLGLSADSALAAMLLARIALVLTTALGVVLLMRPAAAAPLGPNGTYSPTS
ncbi:MAG TPA: lysylphosphatidylglycerol synthase transmembrane domain-containing protein [Candidatus Limnocylindria bacterium]